MFHYFRKAQYHETDQMGVIHHANYIKWMEEARTALMDDMGWPYAKVEEYGIQSPVVKLEVDYKKPTHYAETIDIQVKVKSYTGVKMEIGYQFYREDTGELCTEATSKHCFLKNGKIVSIKRELEDLDQVFRAYMEKDRGNEQQ